MNTRIIVASVAGGAALFLLGFVVYGLLLESWMESQMVKHDGLMLPAPNFVTLIIANVTWALLLSLIFDRWASIRTFAGGLVGGAMVGFLVILYKDLMTLSFMNMFNGYGPLAVDVCAFTVIGAISGGVVGAVLGMMSSGSSESMA
jgi:hypothetical protein